MEFVLGFRKDVDDDDHRMSCSSKAIINVPFTSSSSPFHRCIAGHQPVPPPQIHEKNHRQQQQQLQEMVSWLGGNYDQELLEDNEVAASASSKLDVINILSDTEEDDCSIINIVSDAEEEDDCSKRGGGGGELVVLNLIEKEHIFDKVLTPSDVGKLNRLVIPGQHAQKYFPLDPSINEKGLLLIFKDRNGKAWRFRYSYWNSSQSYVMTKGWSRFVKEKKLEAGDIISFQRGIGNAGKDDFYIDWSRRPNATDPIAYSHHHSSRSPFLPKDLSRDGGGNIIQRPMVYESAADEDRGKLEAAKRLRLFGVNIDCPINQSDEGGSFTNIISPGLSQSRTGKFKPGWHIRPPLMRQWKTVLQQAKASFCSSGNEEESCITSHVSNCERSGKPKAGWCKLRAVLKWWSIWRDVTAKRAQIMKCHPSSAQLGNPFIFSLDGKGYQGTLSLCQEPDVLHEDKEAKWSKPAALVEFATSRWPRRTEDRGSTTGLALTKMEQDFPLELKTNASSKVTGPFDDGSSLFRSLQGKCLDFNSEEPSKWRGDVDDELLECPNALSFDHASSLKCLGMKETQLDFDKLREITSKCMKSSSKNTWNELVHEKAIQEIQRLSRPAYPPKSLSACSHPVYLVELNLQRSSIQQLWAGKQPFVNLKSINLKHSKVTTIPDLSEAQKLNRLNLRGCRSLQSLPSMNDLKLLTTLILTDCANLNEIPELSTSIQYLFLAGTAIEELPLSIGCLSDLIKLDLRNCSMLRSLPSSICELQHLEYLDIAGCTILLELLESISLP